MQEQRLFNINGQFQPLTVQLAKYILMKEFGYTESEFVTARPRWTIERIIAEAETALDILEVPSMTAYSM